MQRILMLMACLVLAGLVSATQDRDEKHWGAQGFSGLSLRDMPDGRTVVSWVLPGPLAGQGLMAGNQDIGRPDLVLTVDGQPMGAEAFKAYERDKFPHDDVTIQYRRARTRGGSLQGDIQYEDEVRSITIRLGSRDEWTGTVGRDPLFAFWDPVVGPGIVRPDVPSNTLGAVLDDEMKAAINQLKGVFEDRLTTDQDTFQLSRLRAFFKRPFQTPETAMALTDTMTEHDGVFEKPLMSMMHTVRQNLDLRDAGGWQLLEDLPEGRSKVDAAMLRTMFWSNFELGTGGQLQPLREDRRFVLKALNLLKVPRDTFYITGDKAHEHIEVIRRATSVKFGNFPQGLRRLGWSIVMTKEEVLETPPMLGVPAEIADAVEGEILSAAYDERVGWVVVGGEGPNRYDMTRIVAVVDPGGDDEYYHSDLCIGARMITDLEGDDVYTGTDLQGPAGGLFGVYSIEDRAGNDRYEGKMLSTGAGLFGVGMIFDRGGSDEYIGTDWSVGAACYGTGFIVDLGTEKDIYKSEFLSIGVGGPRGFGLVIDRGGDDEYLSNGPVPSAYGDEGVYQSFSQGVGFGFRNYAVGGIGVVRDFAGNDRYESGEFSQGGAYYYGVGVLRDDEGDDTYEASRYAQGFGVHQAVGVLMDDAGNDIYRNKTAAGQGAAWDIGIGVLVDRSGNDQYYADGLSQGGAAHQGIAMLLDLDGEDRYQAGGGATQGQSGADHYHYDTTGAFSFSLLLDLGGLTDVYSRGRKNNAVQVTGEMNEAKMENSTVYGLVIDR